jgi:hypothetical protein
MNFIVEDENSEKYYSVSYDEKKLKEILDKLSGYWYIATTNGRIAGDITNFPATDRMIKKRVTAFFYGAIKRKYKEAFILPETILRHKSSYEDYVTFDYSYVKLPDLYAYIDLILNNKTTYDYPGLFSKKDGDETVDINPYYACRNQSQLVMDGIMNYANSKELTDNNSGDKDYDYEGLKKLYLETLKCFKFRLFAVKEYLENQKEIDALSLRKKPN